MIILYNKLDTYIDYADRYHIRGINKSFLKKLIFATIIYPSNLLYYVCVPFVE